MKKLIIILFSLHASLFTVHPVNAQGCLPEGIYFQYQAQVDSFQFNYPGCTEIEGDVLISGFWSYDINNLQGLSVLTSIGGSLKFQFAYNLASLTGLINLTNIGGDLIIQNNDSLESLAGLEGLISIGGTLQIGYHSPSAESADAILDLNGLMNLSSIGGDMVILGNDSLENLSGLENLVSIGGSIIIRDNPVLTSLYGLDNLNSNSISNIYIRDNNLLSTCNVESFCNYLSNPGGTVDIFSNAPGCNNPIEIANSCGITLPCLPYGNYYFFSQADIDNFQTNFPDCSELGGNVSVAGIDIVDLTGLSQVTSVGGKLLIGSETSASETGNPLLTSLTGLQNLVHIGGDLWISENDSLTNLTGLDNLNSIGGGLIIGESSNPTPQRHMMALTSITALGNLTSIGGDLVIYETSLANLSGLDNVTDVGGYILIYSNNQMTNLTGLESLNNMGGGLTINSNTVLNTLAGLDSINSNSITSLNIRNNHNLSSCEVQSICDYLASPYAIISISNNAPGCNSQEEVMAECLMGVPEESAVGGQRSAACPECEARRISCYPNPTHSTIDFRFTIYNLQSIDLRIYNVQGQEVAVLPDEKLPAGEHTVSLDASGLPAGVYYYQLRAKGVGQVGAGKIVKY